MATDCDLPVHYWGLDSTFWVHRKTFVKEVHELKESKEFKGVYQSKNHVIIRVEVLGTVVYVDDREKLVVYGVDDGTGIISCCHWKENNPRTEVYCLGQLVSVQGKITIFRDQRQLTVSSIVVEENPNAETLFWLDIINLNTKVYNAPFVIPDALVYGGKTSSTSTEHLMQFIRKSTQHAKNVVFSFKDLCSNAEVCKIAESILASKRDLPETNNQRQSSEISKVTRQLLRQLEMQGEIFYKDTLLDTYELITHEHHLKPAIIKAIMEISKGSPHDGAHIARITDVLHSSHSLGHVGSERVLDSLQKLVCDSEVYQQSNQLYCIV